MSEAAIEGGEGRKIMSDKLVLEVKQTHRDAPSRECAAECISTAEHAF